MEEAEMQKHILLTLSGLIAGILALALVEPQTTSGAMLLVVLGMLIFNAIGIVIGSLKRILRGKMELVLLMLFVSLWPTILSARSSQNNEKISLDTVTSARLALRKGDIDQAQTFIQSSLKHVRELTPSTERESLISALTLSTQALRRGSYKEAAKRLYFAEKLISSGRIYEWNTTANSLSESKREAHYKIPTYGSRLHQNDDIMNQLNAKELRPLGASAEVSRETAKERIESLKRASEAIEERRAEEARRAKKKQKNQQCLDNVT